MNKEDLAEELKEVGGSQKEAEELASFSVVLKAPLFTRSESFKSRQFEMILTQVSQKKRGWFSLPKLVFPVGISFASIFLVFMAGVIAAQGAVPGETLYPVKKITEQVLGIFNPGFKEGAPLRRAEEIRALIEKDQDNPNIKQSLKDYREQLKGILEEKTRQEVRQESEKNLQRASERASGEAKEEINKVLDEDSVKGVTDQKKSEDNKDEHKVDNKGKNNSEENQNSDRSR